MPKYTRSFVDQVGVEAAEYAKPDQRETSTSAFEVDAPEGFADVPVLEVCRIINESDEDMPMRFEDKERLMRFSILGKPIKMSYAGKALGTVLMNKLTDSLDAYTVFKDNPMALSFLMNVCVAYVLKRSLPPRKQVPPVAAEEHQKAPLTVQR